MSSHASAELLSAYLDQELAAEEVGELETHLDHCRECTGRLEGMRNVVSNLRHFERLAPPPTLDLAVARRIALAGERKSLLDRFEDGLEGFQRQSSLMLWFCVVFALVMVAFFFLNTLVRSQNTHIPVTFGAAEGSAEDTMSVVSPVPEQPAPDDATTGRIFQLRDGELKEIGDVGSRVELAGRVFEQAADGAWHQVGAELSTPQSAVDNPAPEPASTVERGSTAHREIIDAHPELADLDVLPGTVRVWVDQQWLALEPAATEPAATEPAATEPAVRSVNR